MIHILHGFSNVDSEFKPRNLRQEVHYIEFGDCCYLGINLNIIN